MDGISLMILMTIKLPSFSFVSIFSQKQNIQRKVDKSANEMIN